MAERDWEIAIEDLAFGGAGTGRLAGKVVFVPGALPGERVLVSLVKDRGNYWDGRLVELISESPLRREPSCPFALRPCGKRKEGGRHCPGCAYQHCSCEAEIEFKNAQFAGLLERVGGLSGLSFLPPLQGPSSLGYRNRISLHAQSEEREMKLGYFLQDNRTVLDIPQCPLACAQINELLAFERAKPGFRHTLRDGMELSFRHSAANGAFFWRGKAKPNENWLREETVIGSLSVPRESFFQVNPEGCALLLQCVSAIIEKQRPECVIDLYCGVGLFSLLAARLGVPSVAGIDSDGPATAAAKVNAERLGFSQCRFLTGDAGKMLKNELKRIDSAQSLVIVDPPRGGLSPDTRNWLAGGNPRSLVYISCAPDTLARDLKELSGAGYAPRSMQVVDMFPRTAHFETVTHMEKL